MCICAVPWRKLLQELQIVGPWANKGKREGRDEEEKNPILSHLMLDAQHLLSSKEKRVAVKDELRT